MKKVQPKCHKYMLRNADTNPPIEIAELDEILKPWIHHDAPGRRQVKSDGDDDRFTIK